ncbi:MAG TPA: hypothetical protein VKV03_11320 [Candidatus Binataceae bacterium]|nr:hypothetical protein [Candidatus Binataceae bacterium]
MAQVKPASLPKDLKPIHVIKAVDFIEREAADLVDLYFEQANVFSGIVGILGAKALAAFSPYKRHKHPDTAQQRFPDLSLNGKLNPPPVEALESKGSTRPWAIQSHYDHPGWYVVWRYVVDATETIKPGKPVVIWRVDVVFITKTDWKYEGSKAGSAGGGRTHTFGLRRPAEKLAQSGAYTLPGVAFKRGKVVLIEP